METPVAAVASGTSETVLEAREIVRSYPGTLALKGVTFHVRRQQINVVIGENGAGKSTLMRILAGIEPATSGQILLDGKPLSLRSTADAARQGIMMVHQELNVLPNLDVAENIFAGRELRTRVGTVRLREQHRAARGALSLLGAAVRTRTNMGSLPLGRQQTVELARTLAHSARVLILDEPTSALSQTECVQLFRVLDDLKAHGVSIVYISHRLHELLTIGDHFTVLRDGRVTGEAPRAAVDRNWIVSRMMGSRPVRVAVQGAQGAAAAQPEVLRIERLSVSGTMADGGQRVALQDVSLRVHAGEIVGVYGLLGSGRTELLQTLGGLQHPLSGSVFVRGKEVRFRSVAQAMRSGVVLLPEDRQRDALLPERSIRENLTIAGLGRISGRVWLRRTIENEEVRRLQQEFGIAATNLELRVNTLSGGNQQKVVLARCLLCRPSLLLLDEPTRGVDVGAKAEIYAILRRLAAEGLAVLFASSEIEEIGELAQRVVVLSNGALARSFTREAATEDALFAAAAPIGHTAAAERAPWPSLSV